MKPLLHKALKSMQIHGHTLSQWLTVTRFWSFAVSAAPVIVTFTYLCNRDLLSGAGFNFVLALLGTVTLHAAGNILSDWSDYRSGVDNKDACAVQTLVSGEYSAREYLAFSIILFIAGCAIGLWLVARTGTALLLIGGAGVLLTAAYSFLKYHALGDLDIFLIFSVLIILGTSYVVCGKVIADALVLALPIGIITVSVLHANNTIDIESDGKAGIRTFAMLIGGKASCRLYQAYMLIPFICIIIGVITGLLHPLCLMCLIAAVPAYKNFKAASRFEEMGTEAMLGLDQASSKFQIMFSGLLSIAFILEAVLR